MSYYLMHRGWMENPVFRGEPFTRAQAWCWLVENAKFEDCDVWVKGKVVHLLRGQVCASLRFMAAAWKWDEAKVRRFCVAAASAKMITCVTDAGQTVITICNYDRYQVASCVGDAQSDAVTTQQRRKTKEGKEDSILLSEDDLPPRDSGDEATVAWEAFNEVARRAGLPTATKLTTARRSGLKRRMAECGGLEGWRAALQRLEASAFCCGMNAKGWRADLDFLLQPKSFIRLIEGGYDDRRPARSSMGGDNSISAACDRLGQRLRRAS